MTGGNIREVSGMKYRIHSVVETYTQGVAMKPGQHPIVESNSDDLKEEKSDSSDGQSHYHRSEATGDRNGFFHRVKHEHKGIKQITNVNVHIEQQKDDGCSGCFKALTSIFKR
jgi:hypothetical protein